MPLELQTVPLEANTIIVTSILLNTYVADGTLHTNAQLNLQAANLTDGVWTPLGNIQNVLIPDVEHLDDDLAAMQPSVDAIMGQIVGLIDGINQVRKVM